MGLLGCNLGYSAGLWCLPSAVLPSKCAMWRCVYQSQQQVWVVCPLCNELVLHSTLPAHIHAESEPSTP